MYALRPQHIFYNVQDPLERGSPMRVSMEENHIGEKLKSSKKQIIWKFVYGGADRIHEIVLTHSILSAKKIVEFDGQETLFDPNVTPGLWKHVMILDGCNHEIEVRINDAERHDNPKYDLILDHLPFRRLELYRRRTSRLYDDVYRFPGAVQTIQPNVTNITKVWGPGGFQKSEPQRQRVMASSYNNDTASLRYNSYKTPPVHDQTVGSYQPPQPLPYRSNQGSEINSHNFYSTSNDYIKSSTMVEPIIKRNERKDSQEKKITGNATVDLINQHAPPQVANIYSLMFDPLMTASSKQPQQSYDANYRDPVHLINDDNNDNQELRNSHQYSTETPDLVGHPMESIGSIGIAQNSNLYMTSNPIPSSNQYPNVQYQTR